MKNIVIKIIGILLIVFAIYLLFKKDNLTEEVQKLNKRSAERLKMVLNVI